MCAVSLALWWCLLFFQEQHNIVARMEMRVENAADHVQHGEVQLRVGQRLKSYVFPIGGAIVGGFVGGIVAGPLGALAGLKVAALTAAAAGIKLPFLYNGQTAWHQLKY